MFIERLLNQGNVPLLSKLMEFSSARHELIADNIANISTPGYRQKDLSLEKFYAMLQERVEQRQGAPVGSVSFDDMENEWMHPTQSILFHDGGNRSAEQLMTDLAPNAMMHNFAIELLRKQFSSLEMALKERVE